MRRRCGHTLLLLLRVSMLLALKSIPVAFQSTVPLGHCTAWCPSLPHMLHPVSDPPGRRSRWCFSM